MSTPGLAKPWIWIEPMSTNELLSRLHDAYRLGVHERERENLCSCAFIEIKRLLADSQRLQWLAQRVTYLEHKDAQGTSCHEQKVGGWWPQAEEDASANDPDMHDLGLIAYVDAMIAKEAK